MRAHPTSAKSPWICFFFGGVYFFWGGVEGSKQPSFNRPHKKCNDILFRLGFFSARTARRTMYMSKRLNSPCRRYVFERSRM